MQKRSCYPQAVGIGNNEKINVCFFISKFFRQGTGNGHTLYKWESGYYSCCPFGFLQHQARFFITPGTPLRKCIIVKETVEIANLKNGPFINQVVQTAVKPVQVLFMPHKNKYLLFF